MPLTKDQLDQIEEMESQGVSLDTCLRCGNSFPPTPEFWNFKGQQRSGNFCKDCTRDDAKEKAMIPLPPELMKRLVAGELVDSSALEHLRDDVLHEFGGSRGFAAQFRAEFDAAKPGSAARVNLLKLAVQLVGESDKKRGKTLGDNAEPEDLMRLAAQLIANQQVSSPQPSHAPEKHDVDG
jgi:hypothetical protein